MPLMVQADAARKERRAIEVKDLTKKRHEDDSFFVTRYMGALPANAGLDDGPEKKALPQAYLVEQPAHGVVPPHFHDTNQYQVFLHGDAVFGKKPIRGLTVHYASGHTPYGPIVAGAHGAHYLTLRAHWDSGGKSMPAKRDRLQPVPRRHRIAEDIALPAPAALKRDAVERRDVVPVEADGLGVILFNIGPNRSCELDTEVRGDGQYALVVAGSVRCGEADYPRLSCLFRRPQEAPLILSGGGEGGSVLLLQFPPEQVRLAPG